jgi:hypothetical protein
MKAGVRNRTEAAYEAQLELRKRAGEVAWYQFEGITLKLAADCRYTPDFFVMLSTGELELHEVKGRWTDDALVKVRVAAAMFPFRVVVVTYERGAFVAKEF